MKALLETCVTPKYMNNTVLSTFDHDYTVYDIVRETGRYLELLGGFPSLGGQRVLLLIPHIVSFASALFAVNKLGGIVVPMGVHYRQDDFTAVLHAVKPHMVFTVTEHNGTPFAQFVRAWQQQNGIQCTVFESKDGLEWERREFSGIPAPREEMEPSFIFFTSGSTGMPKGIVVGPETFVRHCEMYRKIKNITSTDRLLNIPPVTGPLGFTGLLTAIREGFRLAVPDVFDFPRMARLMKRAGCNKILSTPSILKALYTMTRHLEPEAFQHLEECYLAGEMIPEGFASEFPLLHHAKLIGVYGLSEIGFLMTADLRGKPEWEVHRDVQVKLASEEEGANELLAKSPALFQGYYNQPEITREVMTEDGWFRTGDLAQVTANNNISLVGRKKDLIKKGGAQVVPGEVEKVLTDHPEVVQAAVIGVSHPVFGEQVVAFVVTKSKVEASALYEHCMGRIARYKVPDHIELVQSLPLVSGKIDKVTLRNTFIKHMESQNRGE